MDANINPLKENKIALSDGYNASYYTVQKSKAAQTDTIIFFIQGSEHASLNYYLRDYFKDLDKNVKIYALQKRYISHKETGIFPQSKEFYKYNFFNQRVEDEKEFINKILQKSKNIKNVILFGVSEGGDIAANLATKIPKITHLVIVGSGGMKNSDSFKIVAQKYGMNFEKLYNKVQKDPNNTSKKIFGQTYKYWSSVLSVNPMDYYKHITIPILVASGGYDKNSPVESVYYLQKRFQKLHKSNLTVKIYSKCDHTLKDDKDKSHKKEFMEFFTRWLKNSYDVMPQKQK